MELRQIKSLLIIIKQENFNKAAELLGYSPSTLTVQIKNLEEELGVILLERNNQRVSLTTEGKRLLPYFNKMILLSDEIKEVAMAGQTPRGKLIIGTGESIATYKLPKIIQIFSKEYPQVELILQYYNCSTLRKKIIAREVDVGIFIDHPISDERLVVEEFSRECRALAVHFNHELTRAAMITKDNLPNGQWILTEPGCSFRKSMESMLKDMGKNEYEWLEAGSIESIKKFVSYGIGVAILPLFVMEKEVSDGLFYKVRLDEEIEKYFDYRIQLAYEKNRWISPAIEKFCDISRKCLRPNNGSG